MEATPAPKKRTLKSAARKGLEAAIAQFDELLSGDALADKPAKKADLVIEKARALKELLALEAEDRVTETQEAIDRLETQHVDDARRLAELETENVTLRTKAGEVKTVTVQDPEHAAVREQNLNITAALKFVGGALTDTELPQMAIRVLTSCPPSVARIFFSLVGIDYTAYVQMLNSYKTNAQLQSVIDAARVEGPAVVFARAALAFREAAVAKSAITTPDTSFERVSSDTAPDTRSGEEKLRAAKELVNPGRPRVVSPPIRTAEENLLSQPFGFAGSREAQQCRERVTPVYVQPAQPKEISGGGDFSPWVR